MSFVIAAPETMAAAATDLATIGSTLSAAHTAAAPTLAVMPAGADEVSASIAHLFSRQAQDYQTLAGQAAAFHEQFVQNLTASAGSYAGAEAANTALLQPLTTIPDSIGSTNIGALLDQVVNLFNTVVNAILLLAIAGISIIGIIVQFVRSLLERAGSFIRGLF
jgi:hypothetical protein